MSLRSTGRYLPRAPLPAVVVGKRRQSALVVRREEATALRKCMEVAVDDMWHYLRVLELANRICPAKR